ncbi:MAG: hypothetical protein DSZ08_06025 [Sulfurovum sp.]|nr:MAG: hypothetical protein DSZ08_06025 [Sulfurovum sp.]
MHIFFKLLLIFSFCSIHVYATSTHHTRKEIDFSLIISGGVSLGAYEAGYNWALIKMLSKLRTSNPLVKPNLKSVSGASAGSINSLLSAMYWCQKESIPLHNSIDDNLFYETWVNLGIEDLIIAGRDPQNKSTLFSRRGLKRKGKKIVAHLRKPIFRNNCEVPLGITVTKVTPIVENVQGIKVRNQNFSVPLTFKVRQGKGVVTNKKLPPDGNFYLSIPNIEKDRHKVITLLFASSAFPGAFQQVELDYVYKGKRHKNYFIDGGLYDNVPLELATTLSKQSKVFFFMAPGNMRKETAKENIDQKEEMPIGFIETNLFPVLNSFDIMQSMKLYDAIKKNFRKNSNKKLVLSSRYHPITGEYLNHFGAFLDQNFRVYDYYVGVYDAIYHLAYAFKRDYPNSFKSQSQVEIMNSFKHILGIDKNPDALAAYTLFLNAEFFHKKPKTTDRFSTIYNAFNIKKPDATRYTDIEFQAFLEKLDMRYLSVKKNGFLAYAKKDINNWHKRPLRFIVNRITTLENDQAKVDPEHKNMAVMTSIGAWAVSGSLKEQEGFEFFELAVPKDNGKEGLRTALKFFPSEITTDLNNGGIGISYNARYYNTGKHFLDGFETKASYMIADKTSNFIRFDLNTFKEYSDFTKIGVGGSFFGDIKGSFYKEKSAFGVNAYIDFLDIFRLTYVYRAGGGDSTGVDRNYFYMGIENIPSLIYWLKR